MRGHASNRAGAQIARWRDVQHDLALAQMRQQRRVVDAADAMTEALASQRVDSAPDARRADDLTGVSHDVQPGLSCRRVDLGERLGWVVHLVAADRPGDDAVAHVADRDLQDLPGQVDPELAPIVEGQPDAWATL